jgi:hypothetical protein
VKTPGRRIQKANGARRIMWGEDAASPYCPNSGVQELNCRQAAIAIKSPAKRERRPTAPHVPVIVLRLLAATALVGAACGFDSLVDRKGVR